MSLSRELRRAPHLLPLIGLALLIGAAGCTSRTPAASDGLTGADAGPGIDGTAAGAWSFTPEDDGSASQAVALRQLGDDPRTLSVVARGVEKLQGLAFRLTFAPGRVGVVRQEVGEGWYGTGADLISRFVVKPEGELWAGLGYAGARGVPAQEEVVLAQVELSLDGDGPLDVGFRPHHNLVLDPEGKAVTVSWLGGRYQRSGR